MISARFLAMRRIVASGMAASHGESDHTARDAGLGVGQALQLVSDSDCDAAVFDVNLGNETSEPVARELNQLGTPFITLSGYS
jgi:hypothetical protein